MVATSLMSRYAFEVLKISYAGVLLPLGSTGWMSALSAGAAGGAWAN
jgi:hypothetical protein